MKIGSLTLKWGTLKAWDFKGNKEAEELLKRYFELGASASAMLQHDNVEQKEIVCKLIDLAKGRICNDWTGKMMTKAEAKKYVLEYGNN
jgi:hypothetical protein